MFRYLPEQASEFAPDVDAVNHLITDISVFFTVVICAVMIYWAIKYRRKNGVDHATPQIRTNHGMEAFLTIVPTFFCIIVGVYGYRVFVEMRTPPADAIEINVYAKKWMWNFEYSNGKNVPSEAVIPVDRPVKFIMQSSDVLHSFFVPSMRVKADAIPGRYTYVWFRPVKTGEFNVFCTEYCGLDHSKMIAKLKVVSHAEYDRWLNDKSAEMMAARMTPAKRGAALFKEKGCVGCHSIDGTKMTGPTFLKIWGREELLSDGSKVVVDENYFRNSVLNPKSQIVATYQNMMPPFEGQIDDQGISDLIAYAKTIDGSQPAPVAVKLPAGMGTEMTPAELGKKLYNEKACVGCHTLDGSKLVGPSFKGVYGRSGKLTDGSSYTADDAYIKNSILNPASQVVEGFAPAMPPYQGQLSDADIDAIIAFMKTVS